MSDAIRNPGLYWVRPHHYPDMEPARWSKKRGWILIGGAHKFYDDGVAEIGPRVQTPDEIATAIAAARAEGEKAGRDAGVAIGAANMRGFVESAQSLFETCSVTTGDCCCGDRMEDHSSPLLCGHTATDAGEYSASLWLEDAKLALALPDDATAILAAERAAGREEMRRACITLVRETNMVDGDPESLADELRALVLP